MKYVILGVLVGLLVISAIAGWLTEYNNNVVNKKEKENDGNKKD